MAMPADSVNRTRAHEQLDILQKAENLARTVTPTLWEGYEYSATYGHARDPGTRDTPGGVTPEITTGQRKMRVLGCLLNVPYTTNDATTEAAIVTAVQALIP